MLPSLGKRVLIFALFLTVFLVCLSNYPLWHGTAFNGGCCCPLAAFGDAVFWISHRCRLCTTRGSELANCIASDAAIQLRSSVIGFRGFPAKVLIVWVFGNLI